jgi:Na+/H+-dicarboxylate symporter
LIGWINQLLPLAVMTLTAQQVAVANGEAIHAMSQFLFSFLDLSLALTLICTLYVYRQSGMGFWRFLDTFREPIVLSLAAGSTAAAIPNAIKTMTERLGFNRALVELITPMGAMLLRTGPALFYSLATVFLAQLCQYQLSAGDVAFIFISANLTAILTAGQSGMGGSVFAIVSASYLNLPFDVCLILLAAIDRLCEPARNLLTLMSTCAATALVCSGLERERTQSTDGHAVPRGPVHIQLTRPVVITLALCGLIVCGLVVAVGYGVGLRSVISAPSHCNATK